MVPGSLTKRCSRRGRQRQPSLPCSALGKRTLAQDAGDDQVPMQGMVWCGAWQSKADSDPSQPIRTRRIDLSEVRKQVGDVQIEALVRFCSRLVQPGRICVHAKETFGWLEVEDT